MAARQFFEKRAVALGLLGGDLLAVILFVYVGQRDHDLEQRKTGGPSAHAHFSASSVLTTTCACPRTLCQRIVIRTGRSL